MFLNRNRWQSKLTELFEIKENENKDLTNVKALDSDSPLSVNSDSQRKLFKEDIP